MAWFGVSIGSAERPQRDRGGPEGHTAGVEAARAVGGWSASARLSLFVVHETMGELLKPKFDPSKIFQHASHFHESARRLRDSVPHDRPDQVPLIAHPSMTLSAFASEVYLKCLLCAETGDVPNDHNLKALFDRLQPSTRRRLEDLWDEDIRRPQRQRMLDWIRSLPRGEEPPLDLPYAP